VLTSEEAHQSKLNEQAAKVQRETQKLEKQRKKLRDKENIAKAKKQSSKRKLTLSASISSYKQKRKCRVEW